MVAATSRVSHLSPEGFLVPQHSGEEGGRTRQRWLPGSRPCCPVAAGSGGCWVSPERHTLRPHPLWGEGLQDTHPDWSPSLYRCQGRTENARLKELNRSQGPRPSQRPSLTPHCTVGVAGDLLGGSVWDLRYRCWHHKLLTDPRLCDVAWGALQDPVPSRVLGLQGTTQSLQLLYGMLDWDELGPQKIRAPGPQDVTLKAGSLQM